VLAGVQAQLAEALILGQLDLFVAIRQVDRSVPLIREEELGAVRYVVVAGSTHPLAGRGPVTLEEGAEGDWITGANLGDIDGEIKASLRDAGIGSLRTPIETTSVLFTLAALDAGSIWRSFPTC
jgi:DNA-binding transcriptional LysR family regulator